jgi:endonuclease/exonuclease/phosphatase family metal-dependent hydrolase
MLKKHFLPLLLSTLFFSIFSNSVKAQSTQIPADSNKVDILTWNLYMRPRIAFKNGQVKRAHAIVDELKNKDYDVIVFQEAFDNKARNIIWNGLKEKFPYQSGAPKKKHFYKIRTGVFVISKLPLNDIHTIFFSTCGGSDCFAVKGAVLVDIVKNKHKFQVIGTHLQAANGKKMTGQKIREIQYEEIKNQLMLPYAQQGVPQFFVGDMNTAKEDKAEYQTLLSTMEVEDGTITGEEQYSDGGSKNDFRDDDSKPHLIDYIFCRKNGGKVNFTQRCVKIFEHSWSKSHKALSDHYAVLAEVELK